MYDNYVQYETTKNIFNLCDDEVEFSVACSYQFTSINVSYAFPLLLFLSRFKVHSPFTRKENTRRKNSAEEPPS